MKEVIAFIGAGNMARSLISGLIADGYPEKNIWACDPNQDKLDFLTEKFNIHTTTENKKGVSHANIVVVSVKPQSVKEAMKELAAAIIQKQCLLISIAAGITISRYEEWFGNNYPIVRCMPNTPALLRCGATGLFANKNANDHQRDLAEMIMRAVGIVIWVSEEKQIDVVAALSGSGPAYFFLIMEALTHSAQKLGLPLDSARLLTMQTALGAARMALESDESIEELRRHVTSKGGTTEQGIKVMEDNHIRTILMETIEAAYRRAEELGKEL